MKNIAITFLSLFTIFVANTFAATLDETNHFEVVNVYINSLGNLYEIQQRNEKEMQESDFTEGSGTRKFMILIKQLTRTNLELNTSIHRLKDMKLTGQFDEIIPITIRWYQFKKDTNDELIRIATIFLSPEPDPGIDYSELSSAIPKLSAKTEYIDESIFQLMPMVFALLIDMEPDAEGHLSHLSITKDQKQKLINRIGYATKENDGKTKTWMAKSLLLLNTYLSKGYKCSDERK